MKNSRILKIVFLFSTGYIIQLLSDVGAHTLLNNPLDYEDKTQSDEDLRNPPEDFYRTLSLNRTGTCNKGWAYRIVNVSDLVANIDSLECIFFSGLSPSKVPEGSLVGSVVATLNTRGLNSIINYFWTGKTITQIKCRTVANLYTGTNKLLSFPVAPFISTVGPITINLTTGEYNDKKDVVLIDYRQQMQDPCATAGHLDTSKEKPISNIYPVNQILDVVRLVGRKDDGNAIFLGKSYMNNTKTGNYSTILYFSLTNNDADVNPDFLPGQALPPLANSFTYTIPVL